MGKFGSFQLICGEIDVSTYLAQLVHSPPPQPALKSGKEPRTLNQGKKTIYRLKKQSINLVPHLFRPLNPAIQPSFSGEPGQACTTVIVLVVKVPGGVGVTDDSKMGLKLVAWEFPIRPNYGEKSWGRAIAQFVMHEIRVKKK